MKKIASLLSISVLLIISSCSGTEKNQILTGADQPELYRPLLEDKAVGIVANQTSLTGGIHLVDLLVKMGIDIKVIFAPEHGFRDLADAGESIEDGKDESTGITVTSLYGSHYKPTPEDLKGIDAVVFDIQDVGARFYTYISTLHYVLEACAENNVKCIVLDRPNPNGYYFDGNIADTARRSFVGMHPVPIVHGMTVGEYAGMVNGEGWLGGGIKCDLTVIKCRNYTHDTLYDLPVKPSPNLPNQTSVYLYPSICFFEGTNISLGRGTAFPFQVYGSPELPDRGFSFTPESVPGAKNPPLLGVKCFGKDLRNAIQDKIVPVPRLNLEWVIEAYRDYPDKEKFFTPYFDVLASGTALREQIIQGMNADEIRATWQEGLTAFGMIRAKYLLYD
ncbi:MAG: DUF1343 domain-containing protein [Bacteroidales bacterium]|jgi:uncharacterized protein YbbC (DUF1343 family)|nr:DUF1343 domain-containing protein [Bacteroidales bacterium]